MTTIFIVLLFVMQIISFYFLALLFTKISNFDDLEKKQRMLMDEMDDSITVYLSEIKDENDRLINELTSKVNQTDEKQTEKNHNPVVDRINNLQEQPSIIDLKTPVIPLNIALKSYGTTKIQTEQVEEQGLKEQGLEELGPEGLLETDERTRAIRLFDAGESIEDIAKTLGKGRTEVELILKFR